MIQLTPAIYISDDELRFSASRSRGPGGQHVNKVSTRITLLFDVEKSTGLTADQKERVRVNLSTRISKSGILRVVAQSRRSQSANKDLALERFINLIKQALYEPSFRKKTKIPYRARQFRLDEKKQRGRVKKNRSSSNSVENG